MAPGGLVTSMVADENRKTNKITAEATKKSVRPEPSEMKPPRQPSDRDLSRTVFIGEKSVSYLYCSKIKMFFLDYRM